MSAEGLKRRLEEEFGAPLGGVRSLQDQPTAGHVRYLDLMLRSEHRPDAVVEMGGAPIAYAVDSVGSPADIASLQRSLVFRGDAPYMVVLAPGQLSVYSLGSEVLDEVSPQPKLSIRQNDVQAYTTFSRLFHAPQSLAGALPSQVVHERLFRLLSETVEELEELGLDRNDALSLSGRAMFARFLADRLILKKEHWQKVAPQAGCPERFFATPTNASATCRWLDKTFNGDFLPLSFPTTRSSFARYPPKVFENLSDIMHCRRGRQLFFKWEGVNLSHVPAGLLSQVYEHQAERWNQYSRHQSGVYYTPRRIADYMVGEVMGSVRAERGDQAASIRVLDPAVGGGVFLAAFFRELVAERWRQTQRPPTSAEIRSILYEQLAGFDISEPALRLTALSLYLTALELDSNPQPLSALRFEPLRGRVLFDVREPNTPPGTSALGSLRNQPEHNGKYDVVIGNPPWTALTGSVTRQINREINTLVRKRRSVHDALYLPDKVPDVGFLWCSTGWARDDGWIAMAMHSRILFKQSKPGIAARRSTFELLDVTGVLNGAELRTTDVWPEMTAPFCLIFARNRLPQDSSAFFMVSPVEEQGINTQGRFRVDAAAAQPVSPKRVLSHSTLLKTLFRGTALDVSILRHLQEVATEDLQTYWSRLELTTGQGYQIGTSRREDASRILGQPDLGSQAVSTPLVAVDKLPPFEREKIHRVRKSAIYKGPVVLVRKSPPSLRRRALSRSSALSLNDVVYSESFYGWSTFGHHSPESIAKYIFLLVNSDVFLWFALMTSGEFGVERDSIQKQDMDSFPVVAFDSLEPSDRDMLDEVFRKYCAAPSNTGPINDLMSSIYQLSEYDQESIRDGLATRLPYRDTIKHATQAPNELEISAFIDRLDSLLRPVLDLQFETKVRSDSGLDPWVLLTMGASRSIFEDPMVLREHLELADRTGASRIVIRGQHREVVGVCILGQRRYWTPSRARLLALEIIGGSSPRRAEA